MHIVLGKMHFFYISDFPDVNVKTENETDESISFLCSAKGEPDTYTFADWIHIAPDFHTIIEHYVGKVSRGQNSLRLQNVSYQDSGLYKCNVTNTVEDYKTGNIFAIKNVTWKKIGMGCISDHVFGSNISLHS